MQPPPTDAVRLTIYLGETDRWQHEPLYEALVVKAREMKLAGATVFRGPMGFGASSHLHTAKILQLSADLPIVIEIVDDAEKVDAYWAEISPMLNGGLVTREAVRVLAYGPKKSG